MDELFAINGAKTELRDCFNFVDPDLVNFVRRSTD